MIRPAGEGIMRQQTWFAVIVCTIGVLPGFIVGAFLKAIMYVFGGWAETSDFLYLHALFGFETPGMIYHWIFGEALPNFFQALTGGFVAVWLMEKIAKGANYHTAATITGALYTGFVLCLIVISLVTVGMTGAMVLSTIQCVGIWCGLESAAVTLPAPRRALV
jgi:hypothetical protein